MIHGSQHLIIHHLQENYLYWLNIFYGAGKRMAKGRRAFIRSIDLPWLFEPVLGSLALVWPCAGSIDRALVALNQSWVVQLFLWKVRHLVGSTPRCVDRTHAGSINLTSGSSNEHGAFGQAIPLGSLYIGQCVGSIEPVLFELGLGQPHVGSPSNYVPSTDPRAGAALSLPLPWSIDHRSQLCGVRLSRVTTSGRSST